jgi:mRNA interferase RelE/StbE
LSGKYSVAETESFQKKIKKKEYTNLYKKIKDYVYPILKKNPYYGPNIKRLKGNYSEYLRYRIGNYRLFYKVDDGKIIIFIVDIAHRKDAYK